MPALWDHADFDDHEDVHLFTDPASGLRAIIAIHSTHLGPAGGGARFWHYADSDAALTDALRLSRGMSYKNALAGLAMGGGKGVILAGPDRIKSPDVIAAFARSIARLDGRYVTAQDVGMALEDMIAISQITPFVSGLPPEPGRAGGNPGPATARGVFLGVEAAAQQALGCDTLRGIHVAIQGTGSVGSGLARHLAQAGARLTLTDATPAKAQSLADELGATVVEPGAIMTVEADIFSPCALGAILTDESIAALRVKAVAGGANNQLARPEQGKALVARNILYAPDYVINAGGIINVATGYLNDGGQDMVDAKINTIPGRLRAIWEECAATGTPSSDIADAMARRAIGRG